MRISGIEKIFRILWYIIAIGLTLYLGVSMWKTGEASSINILIFMLTAILGYFCVSVLVNRSPVLSNILGMSANVGEMYTHVLFGNIGMAASSLYYFITHIVGLSLWTRKENQDKEGKVKISGIDYTTLLATLIFCVVGIILMYFFGDSIIKKDSYQSLFILNIIAFVIGVSAQFTMIMRQPFSWVLWSLSNLIWLTLNIISENYIFAVQSILYEINAVLGIYKWYQDSRRKQL